MPGVEKGKPIPIGALLSKALKFIIRPFIGTGIGRFRLINKGYRFLAGAFIIPQGKDIISVNGYEMFVNFEKDKGLDGIGQELLFKGTYEKYATLLFKQFVKSGMTVFAIGANIGYFALLFASLAGKDGKIYAFEPAPQNYDLLKRNIELNGYDNIVALQKAVSDKSGKSMLYIDKSDPGGHSLFKEAIKPVKENDVESCAIEVVSLDEYFDVSNIHIDIIQMDIQGAEVLATRGMANLLRNNIGVKFFTEFWPFGLERCGFSAEQYWDQLNELGFKCIYLINERRQKLNLTNLAEVVSSCKGNIVTPPSAVNLLCTRTPLVKTRYPAA